MRPFVVLFVLYPMACLLADDTALNDGSEGPMPVGGLNGPESIIQMVSETIDVDMGRKMSDVDCHFTFRSHKKSGTAFQLVGFPDLAAAVAEAERRTKTDGLQVYEVVIFNYSTATGGVWKDAIEQMVVKVNLRDGLNVNDLEWQEGRSVEQMHQTYCSPDRNEWKVISRTELQLIWKHFEPRTEENRREFRLATKAAKQAAE
jgi:hypothetical protein